MTENEPTDERPRPDPPAEPQTETGRPIPSQQPPAYTPPLPPAYPTPPPQPQPQPPAYQYPYPQQQQQQQPYYQQPPPQQTVKGGGGTLWLRPESGVHEVPGPPPAGGGYLGAPQPNPYPAPGAYPGYPMAYAGPVEPSNGKAVAAMVLGLVGLFFLLSGLGIVFFVNLPCSVLAWIFGVQGKRMVDRGETTRGDGMAKAGIWTGVAGTILGVLAIVIWVVAIAASA